MLMLIDTRDRWEPGPPSTSRPRLHISRPTKPVAEALVALGLLVAGIVTSGVASLALLYAAVLAAAAAAGSAIPYRSGIKEHRQ